VLYLLHFVLFHDAHHIFIYLLGDIAFVPIEVLLVTLIIHRVLSIREKRSLLQKLNMVIGAFYSEIGNDLLKDLLPAEKQSRELKAALAVSAAWNDRQFARARDFVHRHGFVIDARNANLSDLRKFLSARRDFLLRLLQNPNLLEHDSFTDLLWAVFHLLEELHFRPSFGSLPDTDLDHLSGDIKRAYSLVVSEWLSYMQHLKHNYPYLFSLAVRTNPLADKSDVIVQ
jgi:hypothetical protein